MEMRVTLNNKWIIKFLFAVTSLTILASFQSPAQVKPLNVILIVADDLGYSDLASYGNTHIQTPNIDALGKDGFRFTQAYVSAPICGPSREGIFTGRYQQRFGDEFMPYENLDPAVMKNLRRHYGSLKKVNTGLENLKPDLLVNRKNFNDGLPATEITIAQLLKQKGYTTGLVGKWNLGIGDGFYPEQRGYDYSYYFEGALTRYVDDPIDTNRYINQHLPWSFSELPAWAPRYGSTAIREGHNKVKDTGYLTFSFASKAIDFIETYKNVPFFLTLTFNAPHDPFQVPKEYFNRIQGVTDTVQRVYYGMIEALDDAIGQVMKKLENEGLDKNTLIIFLSDNGGATYTRATTNEPLRGGKCTHFEGGLLVPFFIKYPGVLKGNNTYDAPVSSLDIFATIAAAANSALASDRVYDGVNLIPYLNKEKDSLPHHVFYWRNGYSKAIRKGEWKLYSNEKSKKTWLFNLGNDREELHDLSKQYPNKVNELQKELDRWEKAQFIKPRWKSSANVLIDVNGEMIYFPT
jgi:arylsulfatase A-like enzyme